MDANEKEFRAVISLAITQDIERYNEMLPDEAHEAIAAEWDEQMAEVFELLFFKAICECSNGMTEFIEMEREDGDGIYMTPICSCDCNEAGQQ